MKVLITGACGFVGSTLAAGLVEAGMEVIGADNLIRPGSELNRSALTRLGVKNHHVDLRCPEDLLSLPAADYVIDAAANPSVLAGVDGKSSSKQVFDHNLLSTLHLLEYCKRHRAGFVLLSTSRVYAVPPLAGLPMKAGADAFVLDTSKPLPAGVGASGVTEEFSTTPPLSLYGTSKLTSELLALEYGLTFDFPVWINRCGVLAGKGQFGRADQGIFAFWINAWLRKRPLKYIGFGGRGLQVRDFMHPLDLIPLLQLQMQRGTAPTKRVYNLGGGTACAMSLLQLSNWCRDRFGDHAVQVDSVERKFDIPWMIMDSSAARADFGWSPSRTAGAILEEIAVHATANPGWLEISAP